MTDAAAPAADRPWLGPVLLLLGGVAIGFAPIGLRLSEFGPQATALWRYLFALPMIWLLARAFGTGIGRPSIAALAAGVFFGLDIVFWHEALTLTSVANATFIVNVGNALLGVFAFLILREPLGRIWPAAAAIAVAGAWLLSRGAGAGAPGAVQGDLLAAAAAVFVALYMVASRVARRTGDAVTVIFWATVAETVVAAGAVAFTGERVLPPSPDWFWAPLALAVLVQMLGQTLIISGVGRTPAAAAGLLVLVQPVAAALLAWPLFGETLAPLQLVGAGLLLVGVWLAGRR